MDINLITKKIISCAIEVHINLGPGLFESTYEKCLKYELEKAGLKVQNQVIIPLTYKELNLDSGYRLDLIVEKKVIVELKTCELTSLHTSQILTYLKLTNKKVGLLINFNVDLLKNGIRRFVL